MKVLFCGLKYDYGKPSLGLSFEYRNFFESLKTMAGVEAEFFAMDEVMSAVGRDTMNSRLIKEVQGKKPDLLFCFLFTEEIKKETIEFITKKTSTKTFNWFADDHWRSPIFSKFWAPLFTAVSTTDSEAVAKYKSIGVNVIKTQWAAGAKELGIGNQGLNKYHVTFVGKNYGNREKYIQYLKNHNLAVEAFGTGWGSGRVDEKKMLEIFSESKINLNFTESYFNLPKQLAGLIIKKEMGKYRFRGQHFASNLESLYGAMRPQIKARIFEIPARGGFLLTNNADNLKDYYKDGKEIVIFNNKQDLADKCKYYLEHEEERKNIALAGYQRTIKEHTYAHRFAEIFKAMGL